MSRGRLVRNAKLTLLFTAALGGSTLFSSCGMTDVKNNVIAGALAFIKGYTTDLIDANVPDPAALL